MIKNNNHNLGSSKKSSEKVVEESINVAPNFSSGIKSNLLSSQLNSSAGASSQPANTFEAGQPATATEIVQNRKFTSRIIAILSVLIIFLLAVVALLAAYNLYRTTYKNIQKSRVATNIDTTSVDLGSSIGTTSQGIGILQVNGDATITNNLTAGSISGNGSGLTSVNADTLNFQPGSFYRNASNINAGTLADQYLSPNVALLNANQTFSGNNSFAGNNNYSGTNTFTGTLNLPGTLTLGTLTYAVPTVQAAGSLTNDGAGNLFWQPLGACATCITDGGNAFASTISIGTSNNQDLELITNGIARLTFDTAGNATFAGPVYGDGTYLTGVAKLALNNQTFTGNNQIFQNTVNATDAFEVKNSGAVSILSVDTLNGRVVAPTLQANTIVPTGAFTLGSSTQVFSLQGSGSSTISVNGGGFNTTVGFNGVPIGNVTYNFDRTPAAGTYTICTTTGNCAGVGGGVTTTGGTAGKLAKFTSSNGIADSLLSESGSVVTATGTFKVISNSPDYLTLDSYGVKVTSGANNTTYLFPSVAGTNSYDVCTSSGNCFGAGGSGANTALSNLASVAINTSLLPGITGPIDLGSATKPFGSLYIYGSSATPASQNFRLTGTATGTRTITFPDYTGTVCTTDGTTAQVCSGYANNALSNLGTVALNSALQPATAGGLSLGVSTLPFSDLYLSGTSATPATNRFRITGASTGGLRTITLPNESGTVCTTASVCTGYLSASSTAYINNQIASSQSASYWISGTGIVGTKLGVGIASNTFGTVEKLRVNTPTTTDNSANVMIGTSATTSKGLVIQGTASQTANLQEWQDSTGSALSAVDPNGRVGAGTNLPNYLLEVKGGKATELGYGGNSTRDSDASCGGNTCSSGSTSITVSNSYSNRYLLVVLSYYSSTAFVSSITYNGYNMHLVSSVTQGVNRQNIYAINEAELAANGAGVARNVSVTLSANVRWILSASYFYNVSQAVDLWDASYNPLPSASNAASAYMLATSITPITSGGGDYIFMAASATNANWDTPLMPFSACSPYNCTNTGVPGQITQVSSEWADAGTFAAIIESRTGYAALTNKFSQRPVKVILDASSPTYGSSNLTLQAVNLKPVESTINSTGSVAYFSSNCPAASCTDSANILTLNQQYASASGAVLNILNSGTGNSLSVQGGTASAYTAKFTNSTNAAGAGGIQIIAGQNTWSSNSNLIQFQRPNGTEIGKIEQNASTTVAYTTTSDARLKENVVDTSYSLDTVLSLKVHDYNFTTDANKQKLTGFIAQELYQLFPDAVSVGSDEVDGNGNLVNPWGVDYGKLTPLLTKGIQDLNTKVDTMSTGLSTTILQTLADANAIELKGDLTIGGLLVVKGTTTFDGDVTFNSDTAGTATIPAGTTAKRVTFSKTLSKTPIVSATPKDFITGSFKVTNESTTGFDIELEQAQGSDRVFNWDFTTIMALGLLTP